MVFAIPMYVRLVLGPRKKRFIPILLVLRPGCRVASSGEYARYSQLEAPCIRAELRRNFWVNLFFRSPYQSRIGSSPFPYGTFRRKSQFYFHRVNRTCSAPPLEAANSDPIIFFHKPTSFNLSLRFYQDLITKNGCRKYEVYRLIDD
jgi:hypothetical protein